MTEYSPLQSEIKTLIKASGPMPVWRYMELCLTHPKFGYYVSRDPLGREGDFTTALGETRLVPPPLVPGEPDPWRGEA